MPSAPWDYIDYEYYTFIKAARKLFDAPSTYKTAEQFDDDYKGAELNLLLIL